jgi:cell division protease FtsH
MRHLGKMQGGGSGEESIFGMGKSQAKLAQSNVHFSDVAGIEEEKAELIEIVDYLKNPEKYAAMGARTPRGVILYGPPGTGKTLLAKAVAGEARVPFFQVSGSAFEDMLVGVGAKRVRDLFTKAKKSAPSIIFIDELDSVASKRGKFDMAGGSSGLADQTINQLLAEMDGFSTRTGVVVMAATNRLDVLDDAILRPGRFDRHIQVNLPDIKEREAILRIHARNKNLSSKVHLEDVARRTPGFSGAQLENVLNEATLLAVRFGKSAIAMEEIDEAIDRVIAGPAKKSRVITESEKKQIAYHEAGHALVGLHTPSSDVVEKITIIPRGQAAGYTLSTPEKQEIHIQKKSDLLSIVTSILGGRASEEVVYGKTEISTGAANDLFKVTNIVRSMVTQLGMSDVGMTQLVPSEGQANPYSKFYSEDTARKIDAEIEKIIETQYARAKNVIESNRKELDLIVESLLLLETIVKNQIDYIHKHLELPKEAQEKKVANAKLEKEKKEENAVEDNTEVKAKAKVKGKSTTEEEKPSKEAKH